MTDSLALDTREALPDALRVLLKEYPRAGWGASPNFEGLVRFWLERHLMFRRLLDLMQKDAERIADGGMDGRDFAQRLARYGSAFVNELHGHHSIEDAHYFPVLARAEPRLSRGFDILDRDHHALDAHLAGFAEAANRAIRAGAEGGDARAAGGRFLGDLKGLGRFLDRHLVDEEELVVPVILKHGAGGLG